MECEPLSRRVLRDRSGAKLKTTTPAVSMATYGGGSEGVWLSKLNMAVRFFQANLNHANQAQNLFYQSLTERGIGLTIVAE